MRNTFLVFTGSWRTHPQSLGGKRKFPNCAEDIQTIEEYIYIYNLISNEDKVYRIQNAESHYFNPFSSPDFK